MAKIALTGGAYTAHSLIASAQRSLNLVPEPMPEAQGEPMPAAHYPTPGTTLLGTIGSGPIRGIRQATTGGIYVVSGSTVYSVDPTTWVGTSLGTITPGLQTPVSMQDNGLDLIIVDGSANGWDVTLSSNAFVQINDPNGMFSGADKVDYLDTFLLFNKPGTPQFYISGSLAVTFDSLDFANKESFSDLLVTLIVAKREIWLFGELTTEIWYDQGFSYSPSDTTGTTAATSFQFAQIQSVFVDHGCAAKYSPAIYDNSAYWLTRDRAGHGIVIVGAGYQTQRVSTYALEAEWAGYARIDDAIGFTYSLGGHNFYVLTFPSADRTWCYDITTKLWHQWAWIDTNGDEHRHRANCYWPINGIGVVGDWQNGNLYALDRDAFTDNGQPIKRVRSFPHILNDGKRVFYRQFLADMETGTAPQVGVLTTITHTPLWPPLIAQLNTPSDGIASLPDVVAQDWQTGLIYFACLNGYRKYTTALETQSPVVTVSTPSTIVEALAVDPISGFLLVQRGGADVQKLDPTTFATVSTFSAYDSQAIVCVVCNGVSYGLSKESGFSGAVIVWRVDTMQLAGFHTLVVSGSTDGRGSLCAGASGGATASAFLSWDGTTLPSATVPLYTIVITAGAETYDPASWPTPNPYITSSTVGTIAANAIDPTWSHLAVGSLGYDLADGHVLMAVNTGDVVVQSYYIIKVNSATAAVMWAVPVVEAAARVALDQSRINGSLWLFDGASSSLRINTLTGVLTTQALAGLAPLHSAVGYMRSDSENTLLFFFGGYTSGAGSPIAVAGTGDFTSSWALMGGQTTITTVVGGAAPPRNLVSLRWSDDRGHSYGSPITQGIGQAGAYRTSLQWQRLGMARDRVWELSWSVPMPTALQGCWLDAVPAES